MNYLKYLASNTELAKIAALSYEPGTNLSKSLNAWGETHFFCSGKIELINNLRSYDFNAYQFLSGYPELCQIMNINETDVIYLTWILNHSYFGWHMNLHNFSESVAKFACELHNSNILVVGNSRQCLFNLKTIDTNEYTIFVGFNKIYQNHMKISVKLDYIICNDVIYKTIPECTQGYQNILCINEFMIENEITQFELTTGMLLVLWILKYIRYNKMTIIGFNMVESDTYAHFFDNECPALANETFRGHNAVYEHELLKNIKNRSAHVEVIF
mgnify:CR=1 FL=1|tara:strand:+ start:2281 stop:3096 length:816 start_codon:yes stop_codon:yes gene_type:complete